MPSQNVIIQPRDEDILLYLGQNVVADFFNLYHKFFSTNDRTTMVNRLRQLEAARLISTKRYPAFSPGKGYYIEKAYALGRAGLEFCKTKDATFEKVNFASLQIARSTLDHDFLLTRILDKMRQRFPDKVIAHGRIFDPSSQTKVQKPDAVLRHPDGRLDAIELELTAKSERRYRHIVNQYRCDSRFDSVIYITRNSAVENKIRSVITGVPASGDYLLSLSTGKFKFFEVHQFLMPEYDKKGVKL